MTSPPEISLSTLPQSAKIVLIFGKLGHNAVVFDITNSGLKAALFFQALKDQYPTVVEAIEQDRKDRNIEIISFDSIEDIPRAYYKGVFIRHRTFWLPLPLVGIARRKRTMKRELTALTCATYVKSHIRFGLNLLAHFASPEKGDKIGQHADELIRLARENSGMEKSQDMEKPSLLKKYTDPTLIIKGKCNRNSTPNQGIFPNPSATYQTIVTDGSW
ncbi:hypothetical protein PHYBLDRAFT_69707 [Phycomyces blakesleeanus NRRL 1555(-)]|uniref:Uncharacterized protein n=1 Tax=Phycomyces blakesleeanus (strain ATCC 8743b / DSM 1359 / FGSC 10004 / NBRC 33097 / NRRL 1555) TaxID=763407 RepID=A0A167PQA0_PHYB8|nr:hypothetical protein PHYBLDRAFT_69707 [Phycomyces blakesleeanus NRRL 1555(-)]OAD78347.1 hypothetical protein PHYBLDRAFT_69707 [Phycomyces blakesleeanus NRRL 1555(-)]|eukprot:XP_018296387.1 hypothetical protein PHYBLDRAFT_69707 [Phycomyces blakesleeanus NRRL 1555(-)]